MVDCLHYSTEGIFGKVNIYILLYFWDYFSNQVGDIWRFSLIFSIKTKVNALLLHKGKSSFKKGRCEIAPSFVLYKTVMAGKTQQVAPEDLPHAGQAGEIPGEIESAVLFLVEPVATLEHLCHEMRAEIAVLPLIGDIKQQVEQKFLDAARV